MPSSTTFLVSASISYPFSCPRSCCSCSVSPPSGISLLVIPHCCRYSHPLFGVFFYGTIGFCVYILICNKEYEFKLKQYTLITPEQYVMLQYIICSCLSLILAIVKCPFVIFSLQLTLSSFLILLIPVIQRFYHSYIKKDIHLSTNELFSIQSNYTTLLFAVAVNVLPIIILVATVCRWNSCWIL